MSVPCRFCGKDTYNHPNMCNDCTQKDCCHRYKNGHCKLFYKAYKKVHSCVKNCPNYNKEEPVMWII